MGNALRETPLGRQHPAGKRSGGNGESSRLTHPEKKTEYSHGGRVPSERGQRRENRPPDNDQRQCSPSANSVPKPPSGNLKQSVSPAEGGENPSDSDHGKAHIPLDHGHRGSQIYAIHVGDHVGPHNQGKNHMAAVSGARGDCGFNHFAWLHLKGRKRPVWHYLAAPAATIVPSPELRTPVGPCCSQSSWHRRPGL